MQTNKIRFCVKNIKSNYEELVGDRDIGPKWRKFIDRFSSKWGVYDVYTNSENPIFPCPSQPWANLVCRLLNEYYHEHSGPDIPEFEEIKP